MAGSGLRFGLSSAGTTRRDRSRLRDAAFHVAERLEARVLLSFTAADVQQIRYRWNNMGPYARQDLAVAEYENPDFAAKLNADLSALGLTPIAPQAPTDSAPADGKSRHGHHPKAHHAKPPSIHAPHHSTRKDDPGYAGPTVTAANYSDATLPQQISFTFSEDVSIVGLHSWQTAFVLVNLNTGQSIPVSNASYDSASHTITFSFSPGSAPPNGNYVAILHSNQIADASGNPLLGSDNAPGHDYVWGSPTPTLPNGLFFFDGDIDGDRKIGLSDQTTLLSNYNKAGNYNQGDVNYNGFINSGDGLYISHRYGMSLPQLTPPDVLWKVSATNARILLTWWYNGTPDSRVTSYDVYRDGQRIAQNVTGSQFMDSGLVAGASYTYMLVAKDATGDSSYPTQELTVTTTPANGLTIYPLADQTITVDNAATARASFADTGPIAAHTGTFQYNDTDAQDNAAITESNNQGTATDQHMFSTTGVFPVYVTVQSPTESTVEMYMANVIDAALSSTPAAIQATAGSEFSGMVADAVYMDSVAAYPDTNPADAKYISATINWGDGSAPSTATIIGNGNYDFTINGTHTFATSGTFNTTVTIRDIHGGTTTAAGSADVAPALPQALCRLKPGDRPLLVRRPFRQLRRLQHLPLHQPERHPIR